MKLLRQLKRTIGTFPNNDRLRDIYQRRGEKLLQDEDEFLLESMVEKTESLCGTKPTTEQVLTFLKSLNRGTESDRREDSGSNFKDEKQRKTSTFKNGKQRKPQTSLIVTMPDGKVIDHHNAAQTFVEIIVNEVIAKLRPEEVSHIYPTIISTTPFPPDRAQQQHGQFYINLKNGTPAKKLILEKIANRLGIQLK